MKKKQTDKKMSLQKMQMTKITNELNLIKGGSIVYIGGNDTVDRTGSKQCHQDGGLGGGQP